jgi:hypothetical protein
MNTVRLRRWERARDGEPKENGENAAPIVRGSAVQPQAGRTNQYNVLLHETSSEERIPPALRLKYLHTSGRNANYMRRAQGIRIGNGTAV